MEAWEAFVAFLEKKSVTLAGIYTQAKLLAWSSTMVELGVPSGTGLGVDQDNVSKLKAFLAEHTGSRVDVKVKTIEGTQAAQAQGGSVAEVEKERVLAERERREREARAHPSTQAAIDVLGAVIKEIKVDG